MWQSLSNSWDPLVSVKPQQGSWPQGNSFHPIQCVHQSHLGLAVCLNQHILMKGDLALFSKGLSGSDKRDVWMNSLWELPTWPVEALGYTLSTEAHVICCNCSFPVQQLGHPFSGRELHVHRLCDACAFAFTLFFFFFNLTSQFLWLSSSHDCLARTDYIW